MSDASVPPVSNTPAEPGAGSSLGDAAQGRKARRARRESERNARLKQLAEMGKLAAGLAHEIKNPLSTLTMNLQLLREDLAELPGAERSRNRVSTLLKETERLRETLERFLRFTGRMELHLAPLPLNTLVQDMVDFLLPQAQAMRVRIHTALAVDDPRCMVDEKLMKQALLNLLLNALQAMPDGGDLIIRTHIAREHALIDVSDTGVGIPAENLTHIFDAYFTTKKGGTGLGLPTTRRIIEEHRGHITVTSDLTPPHRGTNFRVEVPLWQP
jgi:two-component system, NtrC family, sensor histidine kinase HydH